MRIHIKSKKHIITFVIVCFCVFLLYISGIGCPIFKITGFPCPTCGTTRALISLLSLDFAGYFSYNPVAILYAVALALIIFDVKGKAVTVYYIATAILGVSVYLFRYFI